jgi:antitoxin component YwqK of YwqJK toxin-antitoxin module
LLSQVTEYDDLKEFTTPFSQDDLSFKKNSKILFDSIVPISNGVNVQVTLSKEVSKWSNGSVKFIRFYNNNSPYGTWKYFTQDGLLKYTLRNYSDNFTVQVHFTNNNIRCIRKYPLNTQKNQVGCDEEGYYPDGSMQSFGKKEPQIVINHWELLETGKWRYFYPNGNMESIGKFKSGKKDGKWTFYNEVGSKIRTVIFKKGALVSQKKY